MQAVKEGVHFEGSAGPWAQGRPPPSVVEGGSGPLGSTLLELCTTWGWEGASAGL